MQVCHRSHDIKMTRTYRHEMMATTSTREAQSKNPSLSKTEAQLKKALKHVKQRLQRPRQVCFQKHIKLDVWMRLNRIVSHICVKILFVYSILCFPIVNRSHQRCSTSIVLDSLYFTFFVISSLCGSQMCVCVSFPFLWTTAELYIKQEQDINQVLD